jgi:iron(III) transport system permease protein
MRPSDLRRALRRHEESLVTGAAFVALCGLAFVPPVMVVLVGGGSGIDVSSPHPDLQAIGWVGTAAELLLRSTLIATAVTSLALLIGVPLGLLLARYDVPGRKAALLVHAFPAFLPPFLLALGWFQLFARHGWLGSSGTSAALFGALGLIFVLVFALTPFVTILVYLGLQGIDPSLEEAARLVARPGRVARQILLPLIWPTALTGAFVVFALAFSELGVAMFLRVRTYPAVVFARLGGADFSPREAVALAMPLALVALLLLALERRVALERGLPLLAWSSEASRLPLGRWRWVATAAVWSIAVLSVVPLGALAVRALNGVGDVPQWIGSSIESSVIASFLAASVVALLGLVLGRAVGRRSCGAQLIDAAAVLSFLAPSTLLGVGLILLWNRPWLRPVYGSLAIVVVAYAARYAVIGVRPIAAAIAHSSAALEEAAASVGAGFVRRLVRIVLPVHRRAVVGAWLLTFVFCLRDLETTVVLYPPGLAPLPVRIFTLEANGPEATVAALAVLHVMLTATVVGVGAWILSRGEATT